MSLGIVPDITDEKAVCQYICGHRDCAAKRSLWRNARCDTCKKTMLPGQAYYLNEEGKPEHAICAYNKRKLKNSQVNELIQGKPLNAHAGSG